MRTGIPRRGRSRCSAVRVALGSIFARSRAMCVRSGWMSSTYSGPHTSASSLRCVISRPRLRTSTRSRSNSIGVRWTGSASRRTTRAARSTSSPSTAIVGSLLGRRPRAAQRRLQASDQLARAERLGDVVVRARLQRSDLLLLLAHRRQHEDRHLAPLAQLRVTSTPSPSGSTRSTIAASGGRTAARSSASRGRLGGDRLKARLAQHHLQRAQDLRLVVDHQHARRLAGVSAPAAHVAWGRPAVERAAGDRQRRGRCAAQRLAATGRMEARTRTSPPARAATPRAASRRSPR